MKKWILMAATLTLAGTAIAEVKLPGTKLATQCASIVYDGAGEGEFLQLCTVSEVGSEDQYIGLQQFAPHIRSVMRYYKIQKFVAGEASNTSIAVSDTNELIYVSIDKQWNENGSYNGYVQIGEEEFGITAPIEFQTIYHTL